MQRASYYYDFTTEVDKIFNKNMTKNMTKMVRFIHSTKILERPIKLTKNMLSPYKNRSKTRYKRKTPEDGHDNSTQTKKKKQDTTNQIQKYFPIIID